MISNRKMTGAAAVVAAVVVSSSASADPTVGDRFVQLTRASQWRAVATIPLNFATHHPQGMVKVGDRIFLSSVEIIEPTQRFASPRDGLDRSAGRGRGHLFEIDLQGNLRRQITLGESDIYHPGGIDYDGRSIWVPVAEYRPNSRSIIYRVDPATLQATELFRFPDHIGGVVHNTGANSLHGVSWGSRRFYRWMLDRELRVTNATEPPERLRTLNPAHYIDYQDCRYLGDNRMLCAGVVKYRMSAAAPEFALGGLELVDLAASRPLHQIPVPLWTDRGLVMTQNPFAVEAHGTGLRFYFIPEDDHSRLFVYDVTP